MFTEYVDDFPHFSESLPGLLKRSVNEFLATFCPATHRFGPFPQVFQDYQVLSEATRDQYGVVYDAIQTSVNRRVQFRAFFFMSEQVLEKARKLAASSSPNFDGVLEIVVIDGYSFLCQRSIQGLSVEEAIKQKGGAISPASAIELVRKLAAALVELHDLGVSHYNICPKNVILTEYEEPVLTNFGFCRPAASNLLVEWSQVHDHANDWFALEKTGSQEDIAALGHLLKLLLWSSFNIIDSPKETTIAGARASAESVVSRLANFDVELSAIVARAIGVPGAGRYYLMSELHEALLIWENQANLGQHVPFNQSSNGSSRFADPLRLSVDGAEKAPLEQERDSKQTFETDSQRTDDSHRLESHIQNAERCSPVSDRPPLSGAASATRVLKWAKNAGSKITALLANRNGNDQ